VLAIPVLGGCVVVLYGLAARESFGGGGGAGASPWAVVLTVWFLGIGTAAWGEWRDASGAAPAVPQKPGQRGRASSLVAFGAVVAGAVLTYAGSVELGLGPVVASGVAGIAAALLAPAVAVPFFCGSFVGMASPLLLGYGGIVLAGIIAGVLYVLSIGVFAGIGGKLGTIALIGCLGAAVVLQEPFLPGVVPTPDLLPGLLVVLVPWSVAGGWGTFMVHMRVLPRFTGGPVLASGAVGVLAGVLLPLLHGEEMGTLTALGVFSASFAGMSNRRRCPRAWEMVPAGVLCALVLMYAAPWFGGTGGKLGAAAFGAVMGTRGLAELADLVRMRRRGAQLR